jgi:pimeloyl-ACP methyl ester carboxylesterase
MIVAALLLFNLVVLPGCFYAFVTHQYFSMICVRPKQAGKKKVIKTVIPEDYRILRIEGETGGLQGYYRSKTGAGLVLLVHGWMDDGLSRLKAADFYHSLGYDVFLPDLRGHGGSSGKYLGMGITDGRDLADWLLYFKRELGEQTEIILDGVSTGAAAVLQLEPELINRKASAVIADSSYENPGQLFDKMLPIASGLIKRIYAPGIGFWCRRLGEFKIKGSSTIESIGRIQIPVLLIGGGQDKLVPVQTQHRLKAACGGACELYIMEAASHARASTLEPETYEAIIMKFLENNQGGKAYDREHTMGDEFPTQNRG